MLFWTNEHAVTLYKLPCIVHATGLIVSCMGIQVNIFNYSINFHTSCVYNDQKIRFGKQVTFYSVINKLLRMKVYAFSWCP